jgi:hypothetical protein
MPAQLQPLGVRVARLAGYRDRSGALHALALTGEADQLALVDGDAQGWRPLQLPTGFRPVDFALERDGRRLRIIGYLEGKPVALRAATSPRPTRAPSWLGQLLAKDSGR